MNDSDMADKEDDDEDEDVFVKIEETGTYGLSAGKDSTSLP